MKVTVAVGMLTLCAWLIWPRGRTVTIYATSTLPFPAVATFCLPDDAGCTAVQRPINPGEKVGVAWYFSAGDPMSYEVALTADGPIASAIYGGPMPFRGEIVRQIGRQKLSFQTIALDEHYGSDIVFAAPAVEDQAFLLMPMAPTLEEAREHARQLATVLPLRLRFLEKMKGFVSMPIVIHAALTDDSPFAPGVTVTAADSVTALGGRVNLQPGDVIQRINDAPVFSTADVYRVLWEHVNARTAAAPIVFAASRGNRTVETISSVSFNDAFFIPSEDDAPEAFVRALTDTLTLGTGIDTFLLCTSRDEAASGRSPCSIREGNRKLLMRQQHATADLLGSLAATPVPILRGPFTRVLPASRTGRFAATVLGEAAEGALLAANHAPPGMDRRHEAAAGARWGAGISLVTTRIR